MNRVLFITFVHHGYRYLKSLFNFSKSDMLPKLYIHWLLHFHLLFIYWFSVALFFQFSNAHLTCNNYLRSIAFFYLNTTVPLGHLECCRYWEYFAIQHMTVLSNFIWQLLQQDEPQTITRSFARRWLYHTTNYNWLRSISTSVHFPVNDLLFLVHQSLGEHTVLNQEETVFLILFIKLSLYVKVCPAILPSLWNNDKNLIPPNTRNKSLRISPYSLARLGGPL